MQKGNAHFSEEYSVVCVCSALQTEDLVGSKLLTLVYDPGFHLEIPYVLFSNQTLYGVTSAVFIDSNLVFYNCFENSRSYTI